MPSFKLVIIASIILTASYTAQAQYSDSTKITTPKFDSGKINYNWQAVKTANKFPAKALLVPGMLIVYGVTSLENDGLKNLIKKYPLIIIYSLHQLLLFMCKYLLVKIKSLLGIVYIYL